VGNEQGGHVGSGHGPVALLNHSKFIAENSFFIQNNRMLRCAQKN
jgi:hypothetical protein